jgi:hypothetical protein
MEEDDKTEEGVGNGRGCALFHPRKEKWLVQKPNSSLQVFLLYLFSPKKRSRRPL